MMMRSAHAREVFVHREPVDMRKQYDSLSALVRSMGHALDGGAVFLFVGKTRTRAKALFFDGTGVCLFSKRLEQGRFAAPWSEPASRELTLTATELSLFFEGSELVFRRALTPPPYVAKARPRVHEVLHEALSTLP
jgi:transposase